MKVRRVASVVGLTLFAFACKPTARPLAVDVDSCEVCRMVISDARFGGEVVLSTGRVHTFDSIECLANYVNANTDSTAIREILVSDMERAELIPLADASFIKGGQTATPMGMGFVAYAKGTGSANAADTLSWRQVLQMVRDAPFGAPPASDSAGTAPLASHAP